MLPMTEKTSPLMIYLKKERARNYGCKTKNQDTYKFNR